LVGSGVGVGGTEFAHGRTVPLDVVCAASTGRPAGTLIAMTVCVLTTYGTVRTVPSVTARTSARVVVQRGAVEAVRRARAVLPGSGTTAVTQPVLAPSCPAPALRTGRSLLVRLRSHVVPGRPVVTDEILRGRVRRTQPGERLTEVVGAPDVAAGGPDGLRIMSTDFPVGTGRRVIVVVGFLVVDPGVSDGGRQIDSGAGYGEQVLTDGRIFRVVSERWLAVLPATHSRPACRRCRQEVVPGHQFHVTGALPGTQLVVYVHYVLHLLSTQPLSLATIPGM